MKTWDIPHNSGATLRYFEFGSKLLKDAPSGFSAIRPHCAFIPPEASNKKLPALYCLAPWTSAGRSALNWEPFKEDLPTRLMRLIQSRAMPACVVICPDLFTDYGGSQFIDSTWTGPHGRHIVEELIPWVEQHLPVISGAKHRGVFGRSSGGFGALRLAMDFPESFGAVACHAGDMGFEWVYRRSLIELCSGLAKYSNPLQYLEFLKQQKKISGWDTQILMLLGMCAFYSPNTSSPWGFDLPIDLRTGAIKDSVWEQWMSHDPLTLVDNQKVLGSLGALKLLFIDCGNRDQYFLQYGSRQLSAKLTNAGVDHIYAEFDDNHSGTNYRFNESLPKMLAVLS